MQNILVRQQPPDPWWVKIADFGISKRIEDTSGATSSVKYSLGFVAPEVLFPTKREKAEGISHYPVDIWAVACISVFMLTKNTPFTDLSALVNYAKDEDELDYQHWKMSDAGRKLVLSMLVRDPAKRPTARVALEDEWIAQEELEY
jgi:serine/threonine protein kinase